MQIVYQKAALLSKGSSAAEPMTVAALLGNGDAYGSIIWGASLGLFLVVLMCRFQPEDTVTPWAEYFMTIQYMK